MQNIDQIIDALKLVKHKKQIRKQELDWDMVARREQKMPEGEWFGWFIMAGRGFGKTRTGAETVKKLALSGQYKRICLLGETYDQVRSIMIEGESGLLNIHTKDEMPKWRPARRELIWPNGAIATCYSAENYQALRGPQFDLAWVDELAKFDNDQAVWDQLMFCLRLGSQPKVIITTTPRARKLIFDLANRKDIHLTRGTTYDNAKNLPKAYIDMVTQQYGSTKLGQQELEGQLITQDAAALWEYSDFQYSECELDKAQIIIAIDPAATANENSDETGIIVAAKMIDDNDEKYYVLEDASGVMRPEVWAQRAVDLYKKYSAKYDIKEVVVETNHGGDILMAMLKSLAHIPWKSVRARDNKYKRAMPISTLYQQKKVYHVKRFEQLEEQLVKAHLNFANDRLDALVWALYSLMQTQREAARPFGCWAIRM